MKVRLAACGRRQGTAPGRRCPQRLAVAGRFRFWFAVAGRVGISVWLTASVGVRVRAGVRLPASGGFRFWLAAPGGVRFWPAVCRTAVA